MKSVIKLIFGIIHFEKIILQFAGMLELTLCALLANLCLDFSVSFWIIQNLVHKVLIIISKNCKSVFLIKEITFPLHF